MPIDPDLALPGEPSPEELREAHSKRYGPQALSVVPLASGRLAVLGIARCLAGFAPDFASALELNSAYWAGEIAREESKRLKSTSAGGASPLSIDELGL